MTLFEKEVSAKGIFITVACLSGRLRVWIAFRFIVEGEPVVWNWSAVNLPMVFEVKSTWEEGMFIVEFSLSSRFVKWSGERVRAPRLRVLSVIVRLLFTRV